MILIDTSILIDYFRKSEKTKTAFFRLIKRYPDIAVSALTKYEIIVGSSSLQDEFWASLFESVVLLPFGDEVAVTTAKIKRDLVRKNQQIGFADMAIAATALVYDMQLATLNVKHFSRVEGLVVVDLE
ncbi:type II toxin-antitoxin system VapC family toxin [Larkinella soli]|uniref:type II toxin-antitoxin system VapC family toxin n=1 Tax=Larkinella soli TaxID=1770527 RepID=UPI000FFB1735|nr:type II toxin-antitoxin system VapC family toxin [Larkinella soli]